MELLKQYKNVEETSDTLYTFIIHNITSLEVLLFIDSQIDRAKNIKNALKSKKINDRLFNLYKNIKDSHKDDEKINCIYLVDNKIIKYKLTIDDSNIASTFKLHNIYMKNDIMFHIDFIIDFFTNFKFIYTLKIIRNELSIIKLNKNKEIIIETKKIASNESQMINEIIDNIKKYNNYNDIIIIHGTKNINELNNCIIKKDILNKESIYSLYEDYNMTLNHRLLELKLNELNNEKTNTDLFVFGKMKDIRSEIELFTIKELYIDINKLTKLRGLLDESYLNFKIIEIRILNNNDIADQFMKNYNGIMAIKYFV